MSFKVTGSDAQDTPSQCLHNTLHTCREDSTRPFVRRTRRGLSEVAVLCGEEDMLSAAACNTRHTWQPDTRLHVGDGTCRQLPCDTWWGGLV
mmetsp:Transcript_70726/g.166787  ORF Transcript_70726/g.166787 Transcript_70726/m.166787 type:complete len:92 (+) Transcript_70726:484-759(+)